MPSLLLVIESIDIDMTDLDIDMTDLEIILEKKH